MEEVMVFTGSRVETELMRGLFEENNIPYVLKTDHGWGFIIRAGGMFENFHLFVRPEDEAKAKELVEGYAQHVTEEDNARYEAEREAEAGEDFMAHLD